MLDTSAPQRPIGAPQATYPSSDTRRPRPLLRKLLGPLVLYHALILTGAFLLIAGGGLGSWRVVGAGLVAVGIALEVAILAWTASLTRLAATSLAPAGQSRGVLPLRRPRRVCLGCGKEGGEGVATCSQCGRAVVSLGRWE